MNTKKLEAQIIHNLAKSKKSIWELLALDHFPLKDFIEAVNRLYKNGIIDSDGENVFLTEKGKKKVNPEYLRFEGKLCDRCYGKRVIFNGRFNEILEKFREIVKKRPLPALDYFQGYMHEYDTIARVALMHYYGDLFKKDFILIGDDDLLSVALSLSGFPSRILVLDIDGRLREFLKEVNREYGFNIEFQNYDVSDPLPEEFTGKFDVFSSEPLETLSGLKAFVLRGIISLKENGIGYFGLTTLEASPKKWLSIEKMVTETGCMITDIIRDFSIYPTTYDSVSYETFVAKFSFPVKKNPGVDWYRSSLFRIKVLEKPSLEINKKLKIEPIDPEDDVTYPNL